MKILEKGNELFWVGWGAKCWSCESKLQLEAADTDRIICIVEDLVVDPYRYVRAVILKCPVCNQDIRIRDPQAK